VFTARYGLGIVSFRLISVCKISMPSNTTDVTVRFRTSPREICGGPNSSGTVVSPSTSVFPRQHICTNAPYSSSLGNLPESNFLSDVGEHWRESTFTQLWNGLLHKLTRAPGVSLVWNSCVIQFIELREVQGPFARQTATAARCLLLLRPCPEHDHCPCYVGHIPLSTVRRLKLVWYIRTSRDLANLIVELTHCCYYYYYYYYYYY